MPEGKKLDDVVTNTPLGDKFKDWAKRILLSRWKIRKLRTIAFSVYRASIRTVIKQAQTSGIAIDLDGARALMDIHFRRD